MTSINAYENLFNTMKNGLTVVSKSGEYTLGDYMLLKAGKLKEEGNLPARSDASNAHAITALFSYVNEKLTVKAPPVKDKTIRSFPLRTMISAALSALVACTLVLSYGATASKNATTVPEIKTNISETSDSVVESEISENI